MVELAFGVPGDLYGRKHLLVGEAGLMAVGETVSVSATEVHMLRTGQVLSGRSSRCVRPGCRPAVSSCLYREG